MPCVDREADVASASLQGLAFARYGGYTGAACDYATVERMNCRSVHPLLAELVAQPFFRYFKVNLFCDCPFWPDDGMCMLRDCSVCECDDGEVPALWLAQDRPAATDAAASAACQGAHTARKFVRTRARPALGRTCARSAPDAVRQRASRVLDLGLGATTARCPRSGSPIAAAQPQSPAAACRLMQYFNMVMAADAAAKAVLLGCLHGAHREVCVPG